MYLTWPHFNNTEQIMSGARGLSNPSTCGDKGLLCVQGFIWHMKNDSLWLTFGRKAEENGHIMMYNATFGRVFDQKGRRKWPIYVVIKWPQEKLFRRFRWISPSIKGIIEQWSSRYISSRPLIVKGKCYRTHWTSPEACKYLLKWYSERRSAQCGWVRPCGPGGI